jgi:hypothetical protein
MAAFKTLLSGAALLVATSASGAKYCCERWQKSSTSATPHIQRGNRVQEAYQRYATRLNSYYDLLSGMLRTDAPKEIAVIDSPRSQGQGYQYLPKIIAKRHREEASRDLRSASYSWPLTEKLIDLALEEIARCEAELKNATTLGAPAKARVLERLARCHRELRERQTNIDEHIRYNRLWQGAIGADRPGYDRWTVLHDAVLERQAIRAILAAPYGIFAKKVMALLYGIQTPQRLAEVAQSLVAREKSLTAAIESAGDNITAPPFVKIERQSTRWIFHVPLYTDIDNREFVQSVKKEVENVWRLRHGEDEFLLEISPAHIPAGRLYTNSPPPRKGEWIDPERHLAVFPVDGAVLTTGGVATYVYGRGVILGPNQVSARVLAHEFGHILGFQDKYFRGYRDLGAEGFQVMEVASGGDDIMGSPSTGAVLPRQFRLLLEEILKESSPLVGLPD